MNDQIARAHIVALNSQVNQYLASEDYCDVEIKVEGSAFKCHRLILAAASEYFHIMFSGQFKESTASEVTLQEVEADTFGELLQFIYTGDLTVNNANLYKLVRAGEFFKLPHLEELCLHYLQQNVNEVIENGLEMLSYARNTGKFDFECILCEHIYENFDYYSKTAEFLEISADDFISILDYCTPNSSPMFQDALMLAVMRWIRHTDHSPQARRSHFNKLIQRISFSKLSSDCMEHLTRRNFEDIIALSRCAATDETRSCLYTIDSEVEEVLNAARLHVYVNAYSEDQSEFVTNVFTLYKQFNEQKWINSYQYDVHNSYDFVRSVVLDGRLYSLSYSAAQQVTGKLQTFKMSSSISLFSNSYLKSPPLILDCYDMCGFNEHIYVYNKKNTLSAILPEKPNNAPSLDYEQLSRRVYHYNRELDTWLPLPQPKRMFANACMTCDGQIVYLIGGTHSNGYAQSYDHRTSAWLPLQPTSGFFENSACCAHQKKIYVSGGRQNQGFVEMYDPIACKWAEMGSMMWSSRRDHRIEPFVYSRRYLVAAGEVLEPHSDMEFYSTSENKWKYMSSLYNAVIGSDLIFRNSFKVIDMVSYKPFGL